MLSIADPKLSAERRFRPIIHNVRRRVLAWLLVPVLLAVAVTAAGVFARGARALAADRFIQSVVSNDGSLGWHQLCPNVQAQIPLHTLIQQADAQRAAAAQHGLRLTADFVGVRLRPSGGEIHIYVVTAHWSNGTTEQRTYSVLTQKSGCVEDVESQ